MGQLKIRFSEQIDTPGSETWRYLLGGETISNLQQVRADHSYNVNSDKLEKGLMF